MSPRMDVDNRQSGTCRSRSRKVGPNRSSPGPQDQWPTSESLVPLLRRSACSSSLLAGAPPPELLSAVRMSPPGDMDNTYINVATCQDDVGRGGHPTVHVTDVENNPPSTVRSPGAIPLPSGPLFAQTATFRLPEKVKPAPFGSKLLVHTGEGALTGRARKKARI